jgi:hypothetical protein
MEWGNWLVIWFFFLKWVDIPSSNVPNSEKANTGFLKLYLFPYIGRTVALRYLRPLKKHFQISLLLPTPSLLS